MSLPNGEITVRAENSKNGRARTIPMLEPVEAALKGLQARRRTVDGRALVLSRPRGGEGQWTPIMFRRRWIKTLRAAEDLPEEIRSKLVIHSLRHTFASLLIDAGQPLHMIAELLGHSLQTTTQRYAHLLPERKAAAVKAVQALLASKAATKGRRREGNAGRRKGNG